MTLRIIAIQIARRSPPQKTESDKADGDSSQIDKAQKAKAQNAETAQSANSSQSAQRMEWAEGIEQNVSLLMMETPLTVHSTIGDLKAVLHKIYLIEPEHDILILHSHSVCSHRAKNDRFKLKHFGIADRSLLMVTAIRPRPKRSAKPGVKPSASSPKPQPITAPDDDRKDSKESKDVDYKSQCQSLRRRNAELNEQVQALRQQIEALSQRDDAVSSQPSMMTAVSNRVQELMDESSAMQSVGDLKKLVLNKYKTIAILNDDDEYGSPLEVTPVPSDDSSLDEAEWAEIQRLKSLRHRGDERRAESDDDVPSGPLQELNMEQLKAEKLKMEEAMARLIHNSQTFDSAQIEMVNAHQGPDGMVESAERVSVLMESAVSGPETGVKSILLKKYATTNYLVEDELDADGLPVAVDRDSDLEADRESESESSESLDEAEKAAIAALKGQSEDAEAMELALRPTPSVLIKDLDAAESEFTEQDLIQQKKEMQQQMAQLMMESRNSMRSNPMSAAVQMVEPETDGSAVTDQVEEDAVKQTDH